MKSNFKSGAIISKMLLELFISNKWNILRLLAECTIHVALSEYKILMAKKNLLPPPPPSAYLRLEIVSHIVQAPLKIKIKSQILVMHFVLILQVMIKDLQINIDYMINLNSNSEKWSLPTSFFTNFFGPTK